MIGSKLSNRYEIVRELGRGGMGVVYLGHDPVLDREVAIKVVTPDQVSPESVERFKREAKIVAKMDHPAIVSVYDSGEHEGALFFVMPYVEGTNLRSVLRGQALRLGDLVDIGIQVAEALQYSHSRGVIHRDVKPENVMVTREVAEGIRVRVTDFGLAMAPAQDRLTKTAAVVGTVTYMSPEQVSGREIDSRSDIYSLGTVLYECLVGQTPFSGEVQQVLYRIAHEIPLPLRSMSGDVDEEVEEILLRCLEKDPSKRPAGREVAEVLSNYKSKLQGSGKNRAMLPTMATLSYQFQRPAMRPFVGREKEFTDLQKRLNAAIAGECQFVLLAGEAGIGKTRLLEELENLSRAKSIPIFHGRFVEVDHALPYQGFCEVIQEYFRTRSSSTTPTDFSDLAADLVALFPVLAEIRELGGDGTGKSMQDSGVRRFEDRTYIFELLARTITRIAGAKPVVLLLEDLHAADVSLEGLDYIVRRLGPTPTLIVGTYRSTEVDKRHRITKLLSGFKGDRRFGLIQLGPFSSSEHRLFLEKLVGGSGVEEKLIQKFFEATEGNPYFATELVRSLIDSGGIVKDESGVFKLSSETAISVEELPVTIQQTVEERIERLPEDQREILSIASVLGRTFEFADLEVLASESENLESAIEELVRSGFIGEDRQSRADRLTFSSGVVRDVLYASLPRRKRRSLHRKLAEELEKKQASNLDRVYAPLFEHYTQADVPEKVIEYGFLLARKSIEAFSPEDSIRVTQTIVDFIEDDSKGRPLKGEAMVLMGSAQRMAGNNAAALKALEEAVRIFEKEKENARVLSSILLAADIAWQSLKVDDTKKWVERGLHVARTAGDAASLAKLLSLAATVANLRGEYRRAQEYMEEAEKLKPARDDVKEVTLQGGTLLVGVPNSCPAKHPVNAGFNEEVEVLANVFETIVSADANGNLIPNLCERWETLQEGGLFVFHLRKDVRLQDGRKLTARDVKSSFEEAIRISSDSLPPAFAPIRGVVEFAAGKTEEVSGIRSLSDHTLQIELIEMLPIYPALLTDLRSAVAAKSPSNPSQLLGTGPFRMTSFQQDSIQLERNSEYWKGSPPLLEAIDFRCSLSSTVVAEGFRSGSFDLARDLLPQDLDDILRDRHRSTTYVEIPQKNVYFLIFNASSEFSKNAALRQAMAGVARTHDLVPTTLGRFAQAAEGLLPPGILGHDPGRRSSSLSLEAAKEMIQSTGLKIPIRLRAGVHPVYQDRYSSFTSALFKSWSEIGIEISTVTPDLASYNDSWTNNEGIDLLVSRWFADYDDPDNFTYVLFQTDIGHFRKYHSSKILNQALEEARLERRPDVREKLYRKIENDLIQAAIFVPLFHDIDYRVASSKIHGLSLSNSPPFVNYSELSKSERAVETPASKSERGVLQVPMGGSLQSLDPSLTETFEQAEVLGTVFETLTRAAEGARIIPWLASSFQAEERGKKFRFRLRDGVRFHDGRRLTARDVRYSFERLLQNRDSSARGLLSTIRGANHLMSGESMELEGFRILSALEFTIELEQPLSFFPAILAYTPASILPEGTKLIGETWRDGCVGTGPFRVASFEGSRSLRLEANPGYWRAGFPKTDGLEFAFEASPAGILSGFKSGRNSLAWNLFPSDVESMRHEWEFAAKYREIPSLSTYYVGFNLHSGPFTEEEARRRVIQEIDVEGLIQRNLGRLAVPARTLIPPALLGYEPGPPLMKRPSASGSVRQDVEVKVIMHSIFEGLHAPVTEEIFSALKKAGFRLNVISARGESIGSAIAATADVLLTRWYADYPDSDTFIHGLFQTESGYLGKLIGNPELNQLIEDGRTETDPSARHDINRQIEELIQKRALLLPLFHEQAYCFARPEVDGLELNFFPPMVPYEKLSIRR